MRRGECLMTEEPELDHELIEDIQGRMILHWNYRNLKEFPQEVLNHGKHIEEIYLKRNCLEKLPPDIGKLSNLTNLYLVGNQLETLPHEIGDLKCLRVLDVSQNYIKQLPDTIGDLELLESLLLTYNQLERLPKCLKKLHRLKQLEVTGNRMYSLPEDLITGLKSLEEFGIDRNPISSLPRNICLLHNLRYFSACRCNLLLLPSLPFHKLVHGSCRHAHRGRSNSGNRNLQFLFDGNPRLNYIPYWVLQLLGTSVECFGCGLEPAEGDNGAANPHHPNIAPASGAQQPQTQLQLYTYHSDVNRPKIKLNFKGKRRTLHFDEDLRHIHHHGFNEESEGSVKTMVASLFEICLRQIHHLGLLDMPTATMVGNAKPVVEPLIVPQKAGKALINISGDFKETKKVEESSCMEAVEGIGATCSSLSSDFLGAKTVQESDMSFMLPKNISLLLKKGPVARCFQCLRPIFTETWPIIFNIPRRVNGDNPGGAVDENEVRGDWDDRQVDGKLSICCAHFCGASCVSKFCTSANAQLVVNLRCIIENELSWIQV